MPLENDRLAHGGELTPFEVGLKLLIERVPCRTEAETRPLASCLGRVLAEDVIAKRSVPPHDNSAVDGYAVHFGDLDPDGRVGLPVTARIAAGHPLDRPAKPGEAFRIFTGAVVPDGPDTIFMEEDATLDGGAVIPPAGLKQGSNRRLKGEDVAEGDTILKAGTKLRPQDLGVAASVGVCSLSVRKPPRAAVFSTGDELRDPSAEAERGRVFDANRFSVMALLEGLGCHVTDLGILADDPATIRAALDRASAKHRVIVTSGGVSRGEEDHVKSCVEALGTLHFWRLAIKPGRPVALGRIGRATFIGLPGNPVAAMVTFMMIARPAILRLSGLNDVSAPRYRVRTAEPLSKGKGRVEWRPATVASSVDGVSEARCFANSGSGILTSMTAADGLLELPEHVAAIERGDLVDFIPFHGVLG